MAPWTERLSIALLDMVLEESLWNTDALTMIGRMQDKEVSARLALHGELLEAEISEVERRFVRERSSARWRRRRSRACGTPRRGRRRCPVTRR